MSWYTGNACNVELLLGEKLFEIVEMSDQKPGTTAPDTAQKGQSDLLVFGSKIQNLWYFGPLNIRNFTFMKQGLLLLFLLPFSLWAQVINGRVVRSATERIPFPTVVSSEGRQVLGDIDGNFSIQVDSLPVTLVFSADDFITDSLVIGNNPGDTYVIALVPTIHEELETMVVVASRRRQRAEEVPISLEIIKPDLINNKGITDLEQAVDQVPGAYAMDGQVSIRGGSGFSYGAGSRVLILWNEVPLLSGDAGDTKWNAIPIENAQQVEVIKGASSVLYGSGALNGIISLVEREPEKKPYLFAKAQTGIYDNPQRSSLKWWSKNPLFHQADVSFGRQWKDFGLTLGGYGYTTDGYRQGETEDRGRINGTIYYKPESWKSFSASLGWNAQLSKAGNFIIWASDTFAYQPSGGADTSVAASTLTFNRGLRLTIDPSVKYFDKYGNKHQLKSRYFLTDNSNLNNDAQSSKADVKYIDYQFQRRWAGNWVLTSGASAIANKVNSYLYGDHSSFNGALYAQGEKGWKKLHITAGVRFEYFQQDKRQGDSDYFIGKDSIKLPVIPIVRMGVHYEVVKHTHLRASFGQGVRYPSVAERYTMTSVGSLNIFPNPALRPEQGWAAEIGLKQGIRIGRWKGFADAAAFINHYSNMMEFTFGNYIPDSLSPSLNPDDPGYIFNWLGFRAENAEEATITGLDFSLSGEGMIGPVKVQTLMGYTYMNPVSDNTDSAYRSTFSDTSTNMLKYRFNHLAKADLQLTWKGLSLGGSMRYNSYMQNIDAIFEDGVFGQQILVGLKQYRAENNGPAVVFDARIGYEFLDHYKVAFIVNNVANTEYMGRPGDIQAPRGFIFQFQYRL